MTLGRPAVVVVSRYPGAPRDGGNLHAYEVARDLARQFEFHFVCWIPEEQRLGRNEMAYLGDELGGATFVTLPMKSQMSMLQRMRYLTTSMPPGCAYFDDQIGASLRQNVADLFKLHRPVALHGWGPALGGCLAGHPAGNRICTIGDAFSLAHESYARDARALGRVYHRHVARKFRQHERMLVHKYDHVVAFTRRDAHALSCGGDDICHVVPNGVDEKQFFPGQASRNSTVTLSFHGVLDFPPNLEAAKFIVEELGPALESQIGADAFRIQIIGGRAGDWLIQAAARCQWLDVSGFVEDLPQALRQTDLYLAPIFTGSGIKNKVLEAMSLGLPIVGTEEAFAALDVEDGKQCVVASRESYVAAVLNCLHSRHEMQAIGKRASEFVDSGYRWGQVGAQYARLYRGQACHVGPGGGA